MNISVTIEFIDIEPLLTILPVPVRKRKAVYGCLPTIQGIMPVLFPQPEMTGWLRKQAAGGFESAS